MKKARERTFTDRHDFSIHSWVYTAFPKTIGTVIADGEFIEESTEPRKSLVLRFLETLSPVRVYGIQSDPYQTIVWYLEETCEK